MPPKYKRTTKVVIQPELQPIKVKDYKPNRVIAWIDGKTGEAKTISDLKYKFKRKKNETK